MKISARSPLRCSLGTLRRARSPVAASMDWPSSRLMASESTRFWVMARALAASGGPWGVVSRQHEAFVHKCGLLQPTQGSLFSYFAWENARPQQLLTALTAEHKALLWESFLADGQQPLEFAWLWEIYYLSLIHI